MGVLERVEMATILSHKRGNTMSPGCIIIIAVLLVALCIVCADAHGGECGVATDEQHYVRPPAGRPLPMSVLATRKSLTDPDQVRLHEHVQGMRIVLPTLTSLQLMCTGTPTFGACS